MTADKKTLIKVARQEDINQQIVDSAILRMVRKYEGKVATPYLRSKIEKEVRDKLLWFRDERKLIAFKDVEVKLEGEGDLQINYIK